MTVRYLYIDDEDESSLLPYIRALGLPIETARPRDFSDQIDYLAKNLKGYDGLILDWALDKIPDENGRSVKFRAAALAQELRTRAADREIKEIPLVLWSTSERLLGGYDRDDTSHDLFDLKHLKESVAEKPKEIRLQLESIALGYHAIIEGRKGHASGQTKLAKILGVSKDFLDELNPALAFRFAERDWVPAHEYARFILRQMILRPSVLIDEDRLAAWLGIDIRASADWMKLTAKFADRAYTGPFHQAWPRWWAVGIEEEWWQTIQTPIRPLRALYAADRVEIIREATGLRKLKVADPIEKGYSTQYQTICEYYRRPLDPVDGVIVDERPEPEAWQYRRYLSLDAAIRNLGVELEHPLRPHRSERYRIEHMKKTAR
jgi:hypothetical protein